MGTSPERRDDWGSSVLGRDSHQILQTAPRNVEGGVYRHGGVFALGVHPHVLGVPVGREAFQLSPSLCIFGWKTKINPNLADASAPVVLGRLYVDMAAFQPVVELFELRQFLPDTRFNRRKGLSVMKFDL